MIVTYKTFVLKYTLLSFVLFVTISVQAQDDGLCYGKAIMPDVFQTNYEDFPIYNGSDYSIPFLKALQIVVEPASVKWEERVNENCLSPNPEDCKMMCTIQIPAVIDTYVVVLDTSLTKDFVWEKLKIETQIKQGGTEEYIPVLCEQMINPVFVKQLTEQLQNRGYYKGNQHDIITVGLKEALLKYQGENALPVGQLDLTTLSQLGFAYTNGN